MKEWFSNVWFCFNSAIEEHSVFIESILTVAAISIAFVLWIETKRQVESSNEAVRIAQETLKFQRESDSANSVAQKAIADSSIALSKRIATTQETFAKVETRAYIAVKSINGFHVQVGQPITCNVLFVNVGKTPARDVRIATHTKTGTGIYPHEIVYLDTLLAYSIKFDLGSGQEKKWDVETKWLFGVRDSITISVKRYSLFHYGVITYRDIFGEHHFTRYSAAYDTETKDAVMHKNYNDAN